MVIYGRAMKLNYGTEVMHLKVYSRDLEFIPEFLVNANLK